MNHQVLEIYSASLVFFLQTMTEVSSNPDSLRAHLAVFNASQILKHPVLGHSEVQVLNGMCCSQDLLFRFDRSTKIQQTLFGWPPIHWSNPRLTSEFSFASGFSIQWNKISSTTPEAISKSLGPNQHLNIIQGQRTAVASRAVRASLSLREVGDHVRFSASSMHCARFPR